MNKILITTIVLFGGILGSLGSLLIKLGVDRFHLKDIWKHKVFYIGGFFYALSSILYLFALSKGDVTFVYPLVSTTYIWTLLFSVHLLSEKMNKWKWIGIIGIILGVVLVGLGS